MKGEWTMYRVMVVDDDEWIRERLKELIAGSGLNIEVCCEAIDGEEALELFWREKPQIVITDINIPLIDGLELSRRLLSEDRDTRVIVITGYGSLEGAQKAIKAGTTDFILKPIKAAELTEALRKAMEQHQEKARAYLHTQHLEKLLSESLPLLRERYLTGLLSGSASEGEEECRYYLERLEIEITGPCFCLAVLRPVYQDLGREERDVLKIALQNMTAELLEERGVPSFFFCDALGRMIVIAQGERERLGQKLERTLSVVRDKLRFYFEYDFIAGVGRPVAELTQIADSYQESVDALQYHSVFGENNVVNIENVFGIEKPKETNVRGEIQSIVNLFRVGGEEEMLQEIRGFLSRIVTRASGSESYVKRIIIELLAAVFSCAEELDLSVGVDELYSEVLLARSVPRAERILLDQCSALCSQLNQKRRGRAYRLIEQSKKYVLQNLADSQLNLTSVSEQMGLSSAYFSSLFKEQTGLNFVDYLNGARVEKAKELLATTNRKVYEVAEAVGYTNAKYFFQIFKKITGMRPKEYLDSL